ncbi:TetR/AcrR family transcriptional regulator [Clavibacter sepedonicus]|uniref:TetR-family transcriptional regulator n=1 Tax=Clavibacter sepedonicus TaxID=31964 RepID=B0RCP4_CLASE|nr:MULTISPECIES: TetR family transcriptional regulator [Clavibacter]MBD5382658.1 TetR family transcriptional regulator [Clavibacter sp.]OQJ47478.1 TetR family transcriptional regulator [Clavibacter sepedonicus]OQJ53033.1 TetR family transcriptional regulator [Clavibacter sepedonicus]UUK67055.1 TetR family transcriptional regulator [Clavibacter sepedonicus]CAQ01815.1 putative TetR-family transcriptional regulator [Clavibacter sepedonicus]
MSSPGEILEHATTVLRRGDSLTIDSVAREAGLTKPGVIHHFATKEVLVVSVVDHILDRWEADLRARVGESDGATARLRAYVDHALDGDFDLSDLAFLVDARICERLSRLWTARLGPWFGEDLAGSPTRRGALRAARLLADGAWFNASLGIPTADDDEREVVRRLAHDLIGRGAPA